MLFVPVVYGLFLMVLFLIWELVRYPRQGPDFGFTAVAFVAYLDVLSLLTGFSIGWALSILTVILGLILTALATYYRRSILFATLIGLLLVSFGRHDLLPIPPSHILPPLLAITAGGAAVQAVRGWRSQEKQTFSSASIAMVACLTGVALLFSLFPSLLAIGLAFFTAAMSVLLGILSKQHRLHFFIVSTISLVLVITLSLPSEQGGQGMTKAQRTTPFYPR